MDEPDNTPAAGAKRQPQARESWWRRGKGALLAAGALATALTAIVAAIAMLWPDPDLVDRVTITSVGVTPQPLSGYVATATINPLPKPGSGADLIEPPDLLPGFLETGSPEPEGSADETTAGTTPASSSATTTPTELTNTPPETTSATPTGTTEDSPTGTSSPSDTETTSDTDTGPPVGAAREVPAKAIPELSSPPILQVPPVDRERFHCAVVEQPVVARTYVLERCRHGYTTLFSTLIRQVNDDGEELPPEEAAVELAKTLERVRTVPYRQPAESQESPSQQPLLDPLGIRASVNLELEGLRGEDLVLYWRLSPTVAGAAPLPQPWAQANPACLLTPGTDLDSASVEIWVPLPEAVGPYQLDLLVALQPQSDVLISYRSDQFD